MEIEIKFNPNEDSEQSLHNIISSIYSNKLNVSGQQKLNNKIICNDCGKEIVEDAQKIVNYCKIQFKKEDGSYNVFCRNCQSKHRGDGP